MQPFFEMPAVPVNSCLLVESREAAKAFPGKVAVGIDARDGMVAVEGWAETTDVTATDLDACFFVMAPHGFMDSIKGFVQAFTRPWRVLICTNIWGVEVGFGKECTPMLLNPY